MRDPAGHGLTTASRCVFIGNTAGYAGTTTGDKNTAVGDNALRNVSTGHQNQAVGTDAGTALTTGCCNNYFGNAAGAQATTGDSNTAVGDAAGYDLTTGANNILIGKDAGRSSSPSSTITTGDNAVCFGNNSIVNAYIKVSWQATSDARDKADIEDFTHGLSWINKLRPVTYRWDMRSDYEDGKPDGTHKKSKLNIGLIAQEELEVEKEHGFSNDKDDMLITTENAEGNYGMQYERLVPILINAVKELSAKNDALEARIKTLEG